MVTKTSNHLRMILSYKRKQTVVTHMPRAIWVEPTNHCNLRCVMCPQRLNQVGNRGYMDPALFRDIIDQCARFYPIIQLYMGGESLLHPELLAMIRYVKSKGLHALLTTNATLLTAPISRELIRTKLDYIVFSFDGYDRDSYEAIRKGGDFQTTQENITSFLRLKAESGAKRPHVTLYSLGLDPDKTTLEERQILHRFHQRFASLPVDSFVVGEAGSWAGKFAGTHKFKLRTPGSRYFPCSKIWKDMAVRWDGKVVPCCADLRGDLVLGDAATTPLETIWKGEQLVELRERMVQGRYREIPLCSNCEELFPNSNMIKWGIPYDYIPGPILHLFRS